MSPRFILVPISEITQEKLKVFQQLCTYEIVGTPSENTKYIGMMIGSTNVFYWKDSEIVEPALICRTLQELKRAIALHYTLG